MGGDRRLHELQPIMVYAELGQRCVEYFLLRGWKLVLAGWRCLHEPKPISNQPVVLGLHTVPDGIDSGDRRFRPRCVGVDVWKDFSSGDRTLSSPGGAGSTNPSQSAISQRGWVSTPCGVVSTRGTTVFVPVSLELSIYRRICDAGTGPYPPRVALAVWLE